MAFKSSFCGLLGSLQAVLVQTAFRLAPGLHTPARTRNWIRYRQMCFLYVERAESGASRKWSEPKVERAESGASRKWSSLTD